jgi:hypothetical protein
MELASATALPKPPSEKVTADNLLALLPINSPTF